MVASKRNVCNRSDVNGVAAIAAVERASCTLGLVVVLDSATGVKTRWDVAKPGVETTPDDLTSSRCSRPQERTLIQSVSLSLSLYHLLPTDGNESAGVSVLKT